MIKQEKLEDLIREKIPFGPTDSRGFHSLKCQCCNDYKVRAGFKFELGNIVYNCWNCSTTCVFEELSGKISKKFRSVLNDYGITDTEISAAINTAFFNKPEPETTVITLASLTKVNTQTPNISLPDNSIKIGSTEQHIDTQIELLEYLQARKVPEDYPMYFSTNERFKKRVIIPFYRNGKVIYWQARSIVPGEKKRYDNSPNAREAVMFNMDQLNSYSVQPLFVSEGVFDALMFNGIGLLGSKLTEAKKKLLHESNRRKIFIIDKDKNGQKLAEEVLSNGWEIAFVPDGADDINTCVQRFGRTWTAYHMMRNIPRNADEAQLAIRINCQ